MPIATHGAVRGALTAVDIEQLGFEMILSNTFHLWQRPGVDIINMHGGLHTFIGWQRPILTDSGGYQVFSLSALRQVSDQGVHFRAPHDGSACFLSPESCMDIQRQLNSDIVMVLDECIAPGTKEDAAAAVRRSTAWAGRCKNAFANNPNLLFGIVQGGTFPDLRQQSAQALLAIGFDGYAIGGLSVGESAQARRNTLHLTLPLLPDDKPRYLMGEGTPMDIALAVKEGIDMFDCVIPTRNGRNGHLFTSEGIIRIKNSGYRQDTAALDAQCRCFTCRHTSRAYLHHLFRIKDMLAARLASLHNLFYYRQLMRNLRTAIYSKQIEDFIIDLGKHYLT